MNRIYNKNGKDMDEAKGSGVDDASTPLSPGTVLRSTRQAKNITEQEAMTYLGLTLRVLQALEEDRLDRLPGDTYVRGYIRTYCRLLTIPADEVIASYVTLRENLQSETADEVVKVANNANLGRVVKWIGAVCCLLLIGWLVYSVVLNGSSQFIQLSHLKQSDSQQSVAVLSDESSAGVFSGSPLYFSFTGNCWVEVVDANNDILFTGMGYPESELRLEGRPPYQVTISDQYGVEISYAGEPVAVESIQSDRLANNLTEIVVGRGAS